MDWPHQAALAAVYLTSTFHHKTAIKIIPNLQSEAIKWITWYLRALWSFWPRHYGIPGFNDLNNPIWLAEKLDFPFGCRRQFSIIADGKTVKVWEVKNWLRNLRLVLRPYVAQPNNVSGWNFCPKWKQPWSRAQHFSRTVPSSSSEARHRDTQRATGQHMAKQPLGPHMHSSAIIDTQFYWELERAMLNSGTTEDGDPSKHKKFFNEILYPFKGFFACLFISLFHPLSKIK